MWGALSCATVKIRTDKVQAVQYLHRFRGICSSTWKGTEEEVHSNDIQSTFGLEEMCTRSENEYMQYDEEWSV